MLLAWGDLAPGESGLSSRAARYCHFVDPKVAAQLVESLQMKILERFYSDGGGGRQNLYYVLVKPPGGASSHPGGDCAQRGNRGPEPEDESREDESYGIRSESGCAWI